MKILITVLAFLLALPASTQAASVEYGPGAPVGRHQQWLNESRLPAPNRVIVHYGVCPTGPPQSCTYPGDPLNIWIDPRGWDSQWLFMHEVGHLYGFSHLDIQWGNFEHWADVYMRCAINGWKISPGQKRVRISGAYLTSMRADLYRRTCLSILHSGEEEAADQ